MDGECEGVDGECEGERVECVRGEGVKWVEQVREGGKRVQHR